MLYPIELRAHNKVIYFLTHLSFFINDCTYSSGILLYNGHNDFYINSVCDFLFSSDYDGSRIRINANGNYRQAESFRTMNFGILPTIIEDHMDPFPNSLDGFNPSSRFQAALSMEIEGYDQDAYNLYQLILDEFIESEKNDWAKCIDKLYTLSYVVNSNVETIQDYFNNLILTIPTYLTLEEQKELEVLIKNYVKKCCIEKREYQQAANIVTERIDDPISQIDSLFAVMQLQTIYKISELDSTDRCTPVNTAYSCFASKSISEYNANQQSIWQEINNLLEVPMSENEDEEEDQIVTTMLYPNFPNPFNHSKTISFTIPNENRVKIEVYNIKGQKINTIENSKFDKGNHSVVWNGKDKHSKTVASGVYFYKLIVGDKAIDTQKMILIK